jgi:hypothetical protein
VGSGTATALGNVIGGTSKAPVCRRLTEVSGAASNALVSDLGSSSSASPVAWIIGGPLAQWQSCRLLICRFRVRVPGGPLSGIRTITSGFLLALDWSQRRLRLRG